VSRRRLRPTHRILSDADASADTRRRLQESLVLVHGGMAQNVGPILEMVTEKSLLRSEAEWRARQPALRLLDDEALRTDLVERGRAAVGALTWERTARETAQVYRDVLGEAR